MSVEAPLRCGNQAPLSEIGVLVGSSRMLGQIEAGVKCQTEGEDLSCRQYEGFQSRQ